MIGIIIQARMNSNRLPGKILMKLGDKTMIEHIYYRLSFLKQAVKTVLATTNSVKDNIVEDFCLSNNIEYFRGSEKNVLERFYLCAKKFQFDHIIRLTADNPFVDIEELDNLINHHLKERSDYSYSFSQLPEGVGAEIFTFSALEKSYLNGKKDHHIEHVNEYILENIDTFNVSVLQVLNKKNNPAIELTVDTEDDYKKACYLISNSNNNYISTVEAIKLVEMYNKKRG